MNGLSTYLIGFRNDVFKLLPMKEASNTGVDNHLGDYLDALIDNAKGALATFPILETEHMYVCVLNNLSYIATHEVPFAKWRKIILNSTRSIDDLWSTHSDGENNA